MISEKFKQYGFKRFIQRLGIALLSKVGIRYDTWLYCTQNIDSDKFKLLALEEGFYVDKVSIQDFSETKFFDTKKITSFKKRLSNPSFEVYGVFKKGRLVYYCWISLTEFQFSRDLYKGHMKDSEGLLFDAFCFPEYRGFGLHNYMNIYRLNRLRELGKKQAVVILLKQNRPARKAQKNAGFLCSKMVTTYKVFGIEGYYNTNKKISL